MDGILECFKKCSICKKDVLCKVSDNMDNIEGIPETHNKDCLEKFNKSKSIDKTKNLHGGEE